MKKQSKNLISLIAVLAALCTGYATVSFGAPSHGIKYTKHNFGTTRLAEFPDFKASASQWGTEICIFCHTPHNSAPGKTFLWNRVDSTATFALYTASPTLNFSKAGAAIGSVSKLCMSCHDGGTAINAMAKPYSPAIDMAGGVTGDEIGDIYDPNWGMPWGPNIGEGAWGGSDDIPPGGNLVNDHPVSFIYEQSCTNDPTGIKDEGGFCTGPSIGGLPLWRETIAGTSGWRVECVTCHDPHINYNPNKGGDAAYTPFLRKTMNSSSLCFTCHNK